MSDPNAGETTPEQRKQLLLVFQFVGLTDILLGAAFFFLGPSLFAIEPLILWICGGFLILSGIGFMWFGRHRYGAPRGGDRAGSVFKVEG